MNATTFAKPFRGTDTDPYRKIAFYTGLFWVITYITSIPALFLFDPVLNDPSYIVGAGDDNWIFLGTFLELILIIANIGTAIVPLAIGSRMRTFPVHCGWRTSSSSAAESSGCPTTPSSPSPSGCHLRWASSWAPYPRCRWRA